MVEKLPLQAILNNSGLRLFIVLTLALTPLAIIALTANEQLAKTAEEQQKSLITDLIDKASIQLNQQISFDKSRLLRTANQLAQQLKDSEQDTPAEQRQSVANNSAALAKNEQRHSNLKSLDLSLCMILENELAEMGRDFGALIYADFSGEPVCRIGELTPESELTINTGTPDPVILRQNHNDVLIEWRGIAPQARVVARYNADQIVSILDPDGELPLGLLKLKYNGDSLDLTRLPASWISRPMRSVSSDEKTGIFALIMNIPIAKRTPPFFLARYLPLFTVVVAGILGWWIINQTTVHPLAKLQRKMRRYQPGEKLTPSNNPSFVAPEVKDLERVLNVLTDRVADDQHALEEAVDRQVKLTKEVHHRVKNNLQIITSLISLHARGAATQESARVYSSIQRRVNALAVVHRNHFADNETDRGIALSDLINELVSSFRTSGDTHDITRNTEVNISDILVNQDTAMPITFLATELLEMIEHSAPQHAISISASIIENDDAPSGTMAQLTIASDALKENPILDALMDGGIGRVLMGLSRQLRNALVQDRNAGQFSIAFPVFAYPR